jgi:hypothetical protein
MKILEWLQGKKTYLVCIAGILAAIIAYLSGEMTMIQMVEAIWAAVAGMTLRAGVAKVGNGN